MMARRQHLSQLLDVLAQLIKEVSSSLAALCAACLLHCTKGIADHHRTLSPELPIPQFADLIEEAGRQCVSLCIGCACHQIQAVNLQLASSDLFEMQRGKESGMQPC